MTRFSRFWAVAAVGFGVLALGCESGGVGDPCVPEDEYRPDFSGYSLDEVNVESRSFQCETRLCLVNHFAGRTSCLYGQNTDMTRTTCTPTETPITDESGATIGCVLEGSGPCKIPGSNDLITVPVPAANSGRLPDQAVYCSCRCAGPDPSARYCECPDGFECTKLIDDIGLGSGQLAGSYCVKAGEKYDPARQGADCGPTTKCGDLDANP